MTKTLDESPNGNKRSDAEYSIGDRAEPLSVSIVIVSWNTREMLLDALRTVLPFRDVRGEVIVVDNDSQDGSADAVAEEFPEVVLIRNERNLGFAGGVNCGLRAARGRFVLLLNTDTLLLRDALLQLLRYADANPRAGIIGPRVLNEDLSLQRSRFRQPSLLNLALAATYLNKLLPNSSFFNRERLPEVGADLSTLVDVVSGCCFLVRKEVLDRVGLLDEGYFMYAEETDLCRRAHEAGFEVHYAPVGEIVHFGGGSSRLAKRRNLLEFRRSILRYFAKHHGRWQAQAARVLLALFLVMRLPYWMIRGSLSLGPTDEGKRQAANYAAGIRFLLRPLEDVLGEPGKPIAFPEADESVQ